MFTFPLLGVKRSKEGSKRKILAFLNKLNFRCWNQFTVALKQFKESIILIERVAIMFQ